MFRVLWFKSVSFSRLYNGDSETFYEFLMNPQKLYQLPAIGDDVTNHRGFWNILWIFNEPSKIVSTSSNWWWRHEPHPHVYHFYNLIKLQDSQNLSIIFITYQIWLKPDSQIYLNWLILSHLSYYQNWSILSPPAEPPFGLLYYQNWSNFSLYQDRPIFL